MANNVAFEERNIKENNPTIEELKDWHEKSRLPLKKFFNTIGLLYKELKPKDKLPILSCTAIFFYSQLPYKISKNAI
jgi:arsenate reductase